MIAGRAAVLAYESDTKVHGNGLSVRGAVAGGKFAHDAMTAYAGADATVAVLYPGDEAFEIVPETTVRLYEVVDAVFPARMA